VDGIKISEPVPASQPPENNWILCQQPQIAAGLHNLTIQVQSRGHAFYFDNLYYWPLADAVFESAVLIYQHGDPSLTYGSGWTRGAIGQAETNEIGAQVALDFHGGRFWCFPGI
jgi:hypothetical protein